MTNARNTVVCLLVVVASACGEREIRPVELYAEDECSQCRMSISDRSFASEIIADDGSVYKFDDFGCFENFRKGHAELRMTAAFVVDFDSKEWIDYRQSTVVETGITTPMGSGKVAFRDSVRAAAFVKENPAMNDSGASTGCSCCSDEGA